MPDEFKKLSQFPSAGLTHFAGLNGGATATATAADARKSLRVGPAAVNVVDFGAVGDGVTDCSAAVEAAMAASTSIYFPAGVFLLNVEVPKVMTISGVTEASQCLLLTEGEYTRIRPFTADQPVFNVLYSEAVTIKNVALFGPGAYIAGSLGIRVAGLVSANGLSCVLQGVQCSEFETGYFFSTYRVLATQCSGQRCHWNWKIDNGDNITMENCVAGYGAESSAGVAESPRTSYGIHCTGTRMLQLMNCDMGACGTALYVNTSTCFVNGHVESCDTVGLQLVDADVRIGTMYMLASNGIVMETGGALSIGALNLNNSSYAGGPAIIGVKAASVSLHSDHSRIVKWMLSDGTLVGYGMSNGSQLTVSRSIQNISVGNVWTEVIWNGKQHGDAVENSANGNFNTSTGRWKCPFGGTYRFSWVLLKQDLAGGRMIDKLEERFNGSITRDWLVNNDPAAVDGPFIGSIDVDCRQGYTYSVSVASSNSTAISVGGGGSPTSGDITSRLNILRVRA